MVPVLVFVFAIGIAVAVFYSHNRTSKLKLHIETILSQFPGEENDAWAFHYDGTCYIQRRWPKANIISICMLGCKWNKTMDETYGFGLNVSGTNWWIRTSPLSLKSPPLSGEAAITEKFRYLHEIPAWALAFGFKHYPTREEFHKRFRELTMKHPDRGGDPRIYQRVVKAYTAGKQQMRN
jgi:hypothetical protein